VKLVLKIAAPKPEPPPANGRIKTKPVSLSTAALQNLT
jgi:hypothetical protein